MKKSIFKVLITLTIALGVSLSAKSQIGYMHSAGITYNVFVESGSVLGTPYLTYNPRLNFGLSDDLSVSLASYVSLGVSGSVNSQTGGNLSFGVDVPVLAQLNWGHHATKNSDKNFGIQAAVGYNFGLLGGLGGTGVYHGPTMNAGVKFNIADKVSLGVRANYTYAIVGFHIPGIGVLYNF